MNYFFVWNSILHFFGPWMPLFEGLVGLAVVSLFPAFVLFAVHRLDKYEERRRGGTAFDNLLENHTLDQLIERSRSKDHVGLWAVGSIPFDVSQHVGGANVFLDIFLVIVLGLLALGAAGAAAMGHSMFRLFRVKTGTEIAKAETQRDLTVHQLKIARYGNEKALLALTTGEGDLVDIATKAGQAAKKAEEAQPPEHVNAEEYHIPAEKYDREYERARVAATPATIREL